MSQQLKTLKGTRVGLLSTGKKNCDALLSSIGGLLEERYGIAASRLWTKQSVYRFSRLPFLQEIALNSDAVVVGLGDCGHGSTCTFHDVFWFEEQEVPLACVDIEGRTHTVRRDGDALEVEYRTLKYVVRDYKKIEASKRPAFLREQLERQGIYRVLRLAGARSGDRVRLLDVEIDLDELPPPAKDWLPTSDGIPEYPYIETGAIGRLDEGGLAARAEELLPNIVERLVAS